LSWQIDEKLENEEALSTMGDEPLLVIALRNLIENALKYGQSRPVEVILTRSAHDFHITIKDNGPGIPKEEHQIIFEPFQRGEQSRMKDTKNGDQEKIPGHGLGLPLSARIATLHGGRIELESAPGHGSTFHLILPASVTT